MRITHITAIHLETYLRRGTLCKKHFPNGPEGITMSKGGGCSCNSLLLLPLCLFEWWLHLIVTWQPCTLTSSGVAGYALNSWMGIYQKSGSMYSLIRKKTSREWSHSSHKKDKDKGSGSSLDGILSDEEGVDRWLPRWRRWLQMGLAPVVMGSAQTTQNGILIRNLTSLIPFDQTIQIRPCHPNESWGWLHQRDSMARLYRFIDIPMCFLLNFLLQFGQ